MFIDRESHVAVLTLATARHRKIKVLPRETLAELPTLFVTCSRALTIGEGRAAPATLYITIRALACFCSMYQNACPNSPSNMPVTDSVLFHIVNEETYFREAIANGFNLNI